MPIDYNLSKFSHVTTNRRVALRAAAIVTTWLATSGPFGVTRALAQDVAVTRSWEWNEADQRGDVPVDAAGAFFAVASPFEFTAVSAHWSGEIGTWPVIEMRISADGEAYSDVYVLQANADVGRATIDNRIHSSLLATGGASFLQYRVLDRSGIAVSAPGFALTFVDTTTGPSIDSVSLTPAAGDIPAMLMRQDWGADEDLRFGTEGEIWPPEFETIRHTIIHHSETDNVSDPVQTVRAIYFDHAVTRGWGDIGYNYLVDSLGNIYEGRSGGRNVIGGHVYQYQSGSSGIALVGDYRFEDLSEDSRVSLVALIAWLAEDLDPTATSDFWERSDVPIVCGHRDLEETTCPGDLLYDDLTTIRTLVAETLLARRFTSTFVPGENVVTTSSVNQRKSPSSDAEIIGTLLTDETAVVVAGPENVSNVAWYQIESSLGIGWVAGHYLASTAQFAESAIPLEIGDPVVVATDRLNLRSEPDPESEIIATLSTGATGQIIDGPVEDGTYVWWLLETDNGSGWAVAEFLAFDSSG